MTLITLQEPCLISGESATPIAQLPPVWQMIAQDDQKTQVSMGDRTAYVHLAQLFHHKLATGDVDLFQERPALKRFRSSYAQLLGPLAWETLNFYGGDFLRDRYPNFSRILRQAESQYGPDSDAAKVAHIGLDLFQEFGYDVPASFYDVHLAPLDRDHIFEERALRYDPRDRGHKQAWDAMLHACKVFAIQMKIQSVASQYGFTYQHGCACNSHLSNIDKATGAFGYAIAPEKRQRWLRSFLWTAWYEYTLFNLIPNTAYLV
ncbi:MAG: hypothetical protein HC771_07710 [Synechococcales cyanobacterium CRU_2_2]|nr:hypothetical protein [Synechococcales cyanobacterium CRU_2_2]